MESPLCRLCGTRHWSRQGCPAKAFKPKPATKDVVVLEPVESAKGKSSALTPAEKQRRYRARHGDKLREANRLRMAASRRGEPRNPHT